MKIYELDDEIMVDSIPSVFDKNKKIFLTTLVHIEKHALPKTIPKIYTSKALKRQFVQFLKSKSIEFEDENFHIWKPFVPEIITLSNGTTYEVLPCCPQDISVNMLLVFRKDSVITHVYVGLCSELRSTLLNNTLLSWLRRDSIKTAMYIPFNGATKRCLECEFRKAIIEIEQRVNANNTVKVLIQLPLFGSESFIAQVASEFRGCVALCGMLKKLYMIPNGAEMTYFTEDLKSARIILTGGDVIEELSTNLEQNYGRLTENCTMKWSPLPSYNELNLLIDLLRPKKVYGLTFNNSHAQLERPVQISSIYFDSNITSQPLLLESLQRQSVNSVQCCLENYQRLGQRVIENVKSVLSLNSKTQKTNDIANQQEGSTADQPTTSSQLQNRQHSSLDKENNTVNSQDDRVEQSQQQLQKQLTTTKAENEESENLVDITPHNQRSCKTTNAELNQKKSALTQAVNIQQKSLAQKLQIKPCKVLCSKVSENHLLKYQLTKGAGHHSLNKSPCPPMSSLVYRKGKRGIGFVDEDSSSTD